MKESYIQLSAEQERDRDRDRFVRMAESLSQRIEPLPFPGIDPAEYELLKADEENLPDLFTPIDERIERFKEQGMKIIFGEHGDYKDVYAVPFLSEDKKDRTLPNHLQPSENMDDELRRLVLANKK